MLPAGQIVQSLGGSADGHDVFVSLFSIMNALGRLSFGFVPELLMHRFHTPRSEAAKRMMLPVRCAFGHFVFAIHSSIGWIFNPMNL